MPGSAGLDEWKCVRLKSDKGIWCWKSSSVTDCGRCHFESQQMVQVLCKFCNQPLPCLYKFLWESRVQLRYFDNGLMWIN